MSFKLRTLSSPILASKYLSQNCYLYSQTHCINGSILNFGCLKVGVFFAKYRKVKLNKLDCFPITENSFSKTNF
ncbi:hypothetical protein JTE90_023541 [Oedothorax gibbosus]|uniref:Uncharacterized protein n=1 Tax=Oedothorax gibbosus TaxID=931172 RepID=A0AAV6UJV2_9ARAC|nr:hypothetical protein JTE90_023541 [Oedothorax gibbosus]